MKSVIAALFNVIFFLTSFCAAASPDHDHHDHKPHSDNGHRQHEPHEDDHIEISQEMANKSGIQARLADGGLLKQTIFLFGRLKPDPENISHVRARFPGLIKQVNAQIGETVEAGEVIARIEANDSLRTYDITSPIDGTVIDRHANAGEYSGGETLFTLVNYKQLELDLKVFERDALRIRPGQPVQVFQSDSRSGSAIAEGIIAYLTASDGDTPTFTAHVPLDNADDQLVTGALVEAAVTVAQHEVAVMIERDALQTVEGQRVVFVQHGDQYDVRTLVLGRSNEDFVEVLSGLQPGERYVVENSFLLKADLEKSGAAHVH